MAENQVIDDDEEHFLVQHVAGLTWDLCRAPVSDAIIAEHQGLLCVTFPDDFRRIIQQCPGGHPVERSVFWLDHPAHGRMGSGLGSLVTLGPPDDVDGMLWSTHTLREYHGIPESIIPIAMDGGGDYMCLDYRFDIKHPSVTYYSHEAIPGNSLGFLANSFTSFLSLLEPPEDIDDNE